MPDDVVLVGDAVAAEHVAAVAGDFEGLAARVALQQGNHLGIGFALVLEAPHVHAALQSERDFG